ncbi:MAG: SoxR reducing system RseC family protein [Clostridia bacterium]|nr:SoxR reducing system RseC family protein [Clostridia bacterium]MBQ5813059.1 SoxR reducing system RseC family protein [Clostridia bacterium]
MTQEALVYQIKDGETIVEITRKSACGGDCGSCKGCSHPEQILRVKADNPIGAEVGDRVVLSSENAKVFKAAYITYILPIVLMIAFYMLPFAPEGLKIISSFVGLGVGGAICWLYSKKLEREKKTRAVIISVISY